MSTHTCHRRPVRRAAGVLPALVLVLAAVLALTGCGGGGDSGTSATPGIPGGPDLTDATPYSTAANASLSTPIEARAVTRHRLVLAGRSIDYTATAGHLTATEVGSGTPQASFFYVAYTADGADPATRPVTFFYNGGPGSASLWLHLGSYGPKRLATGMPSNRLASSFALVDNTETLLDQTDLVFVDAVGTGLSEAIAPATNRTFWGVDADARVFRDFIARYLASTGRTASPRVIFGESYGTLRSAVLAEELEAAGIGLDGVVLLSSVLDYNTNCDLSSPTVQINCAGYLPSYAATGSHFGLTRPAPADLDAFVLQAVAFADERYAPAVAAFIGNTGSPSTTLVADLAALTGAPQAQWQLGFNLGPKQYRSNLLPGQLLGRYDSRIAADASGPLAAGGDPSLAVILTPFVQGARDYFEQVLSYRSAASYGSSNNDVIELWRWPHDGRDMPDAIPDLATAMTLNPRLRVLSLNGRHDLATPFHQTERDLRRLGTRPTITLQHVAGGHMTYLDDNARVLQRAALAAFYRSLRSAP